MEVFDRFFKPVFSVEPVLKTLRKLVFELKTGARDTMKSSVIK